ncbi:MAG: metallophosphoesterase, partial [Rikenellaceae bacterium]|nr:metallophosphoesterase [Rikenellaceae bacterium]
MYIVWSVAVDLAVVVAVAMFRRSSGADPAQMHAVLWTFAIFFIHLAPKLIYLVLSWLDYPLRWITGRRARVFGITAAILAACVFCMMVWGVTGGRSKIRVTRIELTSPVLPEAFDGLRIVEFADLHLGNLVNKERFVNRMVDSINALRPDIVVQCGDIVNIHSGELDDATMRILSRIKARYGVYSVLGNHDLGFYIPDTTKISPQGSILDLFEKQRRLGWHLLHNQTEYIVNDNDSIAISGINFPSNDHTHNALYETYAGADLDYCYIGVPDSLYNVMLSHTPRLWDEILACGNPDLTLSGHVHAMQMKLGIGRCVWSPAEFMYPEWSGLYERDGKYLYVNDGMGY